MDQEKIGNFIKEQRNERGLTQAELAEKLGVSNRTISKWENGKCLPDYSILKDLCKELDISINELLSGERLTEKNYREKLEENIVGTIDYNNKKRNKRIKRLIIFMIFIVGLYLLYKAFLLVYFDFRVVSDNSERTFPYNKKIYTKRIENNGKANNRFSDYSRFRYYIPKEFELVTDKAKSSFVSDHCNAYFKNQTEKDVFDAAILVCSSNDNNIYNLVDNSLFPWLDVYSTLKKYDIDNEIDLIRYYEKNYDFKSNIFTSSDKIKMNYIAKTYVNVALPSYNSFYYLENDLNGFLIESGKERLHHYAMITFRSGLYIFDSYQISFFNNKEQYFNHDNVVEILSGIKVE